MGSKDYAFKTLPDGKKILATAYWAEKQKGKISAIAIAFHGGGFTIGSKDMIPSEQISALNDAGFVVLSADYRLCPQVSLYDGPMQDAKDVYRWCKIEFATLLKEDVGINVNPARVVVIGYSAGGSLALHLGAVPDPPLAILDFYGAKYTKDKFWFTPLPQLQQMPPFPEEFLNKIWDEPTISTTVTSLERVAAEKPAGGKTRGMGKPDLSVPRNAWLFNALKRGTHMKEIVKDGDYERVDPAQKFSPTFPPTFFIHGLSDVLIEPRFSIAAHDKLRELGVETSIELLEGQSHGFDSGLEPEDAEFKPILRGIEFLKSHV